MKNWKANDEIGSFPCGYENTIGTFDCVYPEIQLIMKKGVAWDELRSKLDDAVNSGNSLEKAAFSRVVELMIELI